MNKLSKRQKSEFAPSVTYCQSYVLNRATAWKDGLLNLCPMYARSIYLTGRLSHQNIFVMMISEENPTHNIHDVLHCIT